MWTLKEGWNGLVDGVEKKIWVEVQEAFAADGRGNRLASHAEQDIFQVFDQFFASFSSALFT